MMTQKDIKRKMCDEFVANEHIRKAYKLEGNKTFEEEFSLVSFENILFDIIAGIIFFLQKIFDRHKLETRQALDKLKPHNLKWYHNKVLGFQFDFNLLPDSDKFDNGNKTDEQIEASKIIKQCAVSEANGRLIIKVAKEVDGEFTKLEESELDRLKAYLEKVKDAGVRLTPISISPDNLKLNLTIRCNPLLLDKDSINLEDHKNPVEHAINQYLKNLPFNGELSLMKLMDQIQQVEGVQDLKLNSAQTCWFNGNQYGTYEDIYMSVIPKSGWFKPEDLKIEYV